MKQLTKQRGHFDFSALYVLAGIAGFLLTGGGLWLLVIAYKGLA